MAARTPFAAAAVLMAALLLCAAPQASALSAMSEFITGYATFYGGQPDGMVRCL